MSIGVRFQKTVLYAAVVFGSCFGMPDAAHGQVAPATSYTLTSISYPLTFGGPAENISLPAGSVFVFSGDITQVSAVSLNTESLAFVNRDGFIGVAIPSTASTGTMVVRKSSGAIKTFNVTSVSSGVLPVTLPYLAAFNQPLESNDLDLALEHGLQPVYVMGDITGDAQVTVDDIVMAGELRLGTRDKSSVPCLASADANGDDEIGVDEYEQIFFHAARSRFKAFMAVPASARCRGLNSPFFASLIVKPGASARVIELSNFRSSYPMTVTTSRGDVGLAVEEINGGKLVNIPATAPGGQFVPLTIILGAGPDRLEFQYGLLLKPAGF